MVKEAVCKQACSWLVKDRSTPMSHARRPRCSPCKPGLGRWGQSPQSPVLRVPACETLPPHSLPWPLPPWPLLSAHVLLSTRTLEMLAVCPIYANLLFWNSNATAPAKSQPMVAVGAVPPQGTLFPKGDGDTVHASFVLCYM